VSARGLAAAALALTALALAAPAAALQVPKGTEVMRIDLVPGKFGAVRFEHARHNDAFKRPDGTPVRCRDCHHRLAADAPTSPQEDLKCSGCHARYGDPPRTIEGEVAPALAALRPDGAMEYRSILFHRWCWACHHRTMRDGHQNDRCKLCHERGVSDETMHGRYDAVRQPGTDLSWTRCSAGARWDGKGCEGEARALAWAEASVACPDGYRLPSRAELLGLLGAAGAPPRACAASAPCAALFPADEGALWTSEGEGGAAWTVRVADGAAALASAGSAARARCVRREPPRP
jgi:hypothetical protein